MARLDVEAFSFPLPDASPPFITHDALSPKLACGISGK